MGKALGIWQIFLGVFIIFVYATIIRHLGLSNIVYEALYTIEIYIIDYLYSSIYMFIVILGSMFLICGIVSLLICQKLNHNEPTVKIPVYFLLVGIFSYFVMDLIGAVLSLCVGILALSKNKALKGYID